jgi:hypothetical protein
MRAALAAETRAVRAGSNERIEDMTTTTFEVGDLATIDIPGACSNCGKELPGPLAVILEPAIYGGYIVSLIDRSYPHPATERLACGANELTLVDNLGIIHASPEDIAAAVKDGWLLSGSEPYGCQPGD